MFHLQHVTVTAFVSPPFRGLFDCQLCDVLLRRLSGHKTAEPCGQVFFGARDVDGRIWNPTSPRQLSMCSMLCVVMSLSCFVASHMLHLLACPDFGWTCPACGILLRHCSVSLSSFWRDKICVRSICQAGNPCHLSNYTQYSMR